MRCVSEGGRRAGGCPGTAVVSQSEPPGDVAVGLSAVGLQPVSQSAPARKVAVEQVVRCLPSPMCCASSSFQQPTAAACPSTPLLTRCCCVAPTHVLLVGCHAAQLFDAPPLARHALNNVCGLDSSYVMTQHDLDTAKAMMEAHPKVRRVYSPEVSVARVELRGRGSTIGAAALWCVSPSRLHVPVLGSSPAAWCLLSPAGLPALTVLW